MYVCGCDGVYVWVGACAGACAGGAMREGGFRVFISVIILVSRFLLPKDMCISSISLILEQLAECLEVVAFAAAAAAASAGRGAVRLLAADVRGAPVLAAAPDPVVHALPHVVRDVPPVDGHLEVAILRLLVHPRHERLHGPLGHLLHAVLHPALLARVLLPHHVHQLVQLVLRVEVLVQLVHERVEHLRRVVRREACLPAVRARAEAVVRQPLGRHAEDGVRLAHLQELGRRVGGAVLVGVVLEGQRAVRLADLVHARLLRHPQHVVVVPLRTLGAGGIGGGGGGGGVGHVEDRGGDQHRQESHSGARSHERRHVGKGESVSCAGSACGCFFCCRHHKLRENARAFFCTFCGSGGAICV
mmetsp:Transcript_6415/g.16367  ORF Transcript_6415/g.16367 Transcript_6415/m.16367 type:complete len:360 (+) Transcript_6415:1923-3002(+)